MTTDVKDELSRLVVKSVSARRAEVTSLLRFAGGLHIVGGRVVVEAELDLGSIARRLRKEIFELYGYTAVVHVLSASGIRKSTRYVLRVANDGEALARQTGLLDMRGRPVRGLPAQVVGGSIDDAEAAWRGAFLAHGSLTEPGRSSALEVSCPGPEAALALVGAARRLGVGAKAREVRGADRVVVRDGEAIGALLTRMGAQDTRLVWEERRLRREVRATANRLANFDDANLRRSARAAVAAAAGVTAARESGFALIIGVDRTGCRDALRRDGADTVVTDLSEVSVRTGDRRMSQLPDALQALGLADGLVARQPAVFFDFDGTLSDIVEDPDAAWLAPGALEALQKLAARCPIAVLSGRDLADVTQRVGLPGIWYAGSHGFELTAPDGTHHQNDAAAAAIPVLKQAAAELRQQLGPFPGVVVEHKRFGVAVHYRNAARDRVGEVAAAVRTAEQRHGGCG